MKHLVLAVCAAVLAGCATDYKLYAEAQVRASEAKAKAEIAKYAALSDIAKTGDSAARVAAVMSMAIGNGSQPQQLAIAPPKSAGSSATITIGAGGAGGTTGVYGLAGGSSTFVYGATTITCGGGNGGFSSTKATASGGTLNLDGATVGPWSNSAQYNAFRAGLAGANSIFGGAGNGEYNSNGNNASSYGSGGGGGGGASGTTSTSGGAGSSGVCIVEY